MNNLVWIEISKKALEHNIKTIRQAVGPDVLIAPCIKANAYGHGLALTGKLFLEYGADWLNVNSIDEAGLLREAGIKAPVMVMGYISKDELEKVLDYDARVFVYNQETIQGLSGLAKKKGKEIKIHIKVDTGMSRQGVMPDKALDFVKKANAMPGIKLEGLVTHFANSDEPGDTAYFEKQLKTFKSVQQEIKQAGVEIPIIHSSNSAATLLHPEAHFNMVRPGLSAYGYFADEEVANAYRAKGIKLMRSLSLKTKVVKIKELPKGASISYGCTYMTNRPSKIAVLPIGYYDGYDRGFSSNCEVLINTQRCPIRGRVCMNLCMADITDAGEIKLEDEVVLIGQQGGEEITVNELADRVGTIPYEITTRLRESIPRIYK